MTSNQVRVNGAENTSSSLVRGTELDIITGSNPVIHTGKITSHETDAADGAAYALTVRRKRKLKGRGKIMPMQMDTYIGKCTTCDNDRTGAHPQCVTCRTQAMYTADDFIREAAYASTLTLYERDRAAFERRRASRLTPVAADAATAGTLSAPATDAVPLRSNG